MSDPMIPRERSDYSAIVDRPPLKLPGNARIVFWTIVNYEVWDISRPMPRQVLPAPTGVTPSLPGQYRPRRFLLDCMSASPPRAGTRRS